MNFHELTLSEIILLVFTTLISILWIRLSSCLPQYRSPPRIREKGSKFSTLIIFGSGGHTTEMLKLIQYLDGNNYSPLSFVIASSDIHSRAKIVSYNLQKIDIDSQVEWCMIPRSREVKQSWFTTPFTTLYALYQSFILILQKRPN